MKHLLISNAGLLEVEALTLLGASTKREDQSKIGKFGSGNKYALAYFLRAGMNVRIFSGEQEIKLSLNRKVFREHTFDVVVVDGKESSITTEFGHKWTLWDAVRELYSNAVDEGLQFFEVYDDLILKGEAGYTRIFIETTPELLDLMFNIRDYIATGNEVLFECAAGKVYRKHNNTTCIYYRGIKCYETKKESIFDYDFNNATLAENRLLAYSWTLPQEMWRILFECDDEVIVRALLHQIQEVKFIENLIDDDFVSLSYLPKSDAWQKALADQLIVPRTMGGYVPDSDRAKTLFLPSRLYNSLISVLGSVIKSSAFTTSSTGQLYHEVKTDELQEDILFKVLHFFDQCEVRIPYTIKVVAFDNKKTMGGISEKNEILLSSESFSKGKQYIANTIIEEYIHLKHCVADETRSFQDAVINEWISYMAFKNNFNL